MTNARFTHHVGLGDPCDPDSDDFDPFACAESKMSADAFACSQKPGMTWDGTKCVPTAQYVNSAWQQAGQKACEDKGWYWNGKSCTSWEFMSEADCAAQGGQWVKDGSSSFCIPHAESGLDKVTWDTATTTEVMDGGGSMPTSPGRSQPSDASLPPTAQASAGVSKTKLIVGGVVLAAPPRSS